ncbi:MAG: copper resistance protein CopD, partial [Candidatus Marinimicrobia bacterium]|nr:copper resistance protein CopD [Candidatus Neomarinimicrobiota bacterium]
MITRFYLVHYYASDVSQWLNLDLHISRAFMVNLSCLLLTILLAAHARFRVIPNLDKDNLRYLATHIISVTIVSVVFV